MSIDKLWKRSIIVYQLVCNVQTKWGKHGPSASTLSYSFRVVVFGFLCVWFTLGYAKASKGSVSILAGQFWPASQRRNLEDGATLRDVVYLEGEEC